MVKRDKIYFCFGKILSILKEDFGMKGKLLKRLCAVALTALMLTGVSTALPGMIDLGVNVNAAQSETPATSFEYETSVSGDVTITKFTGSESEVVVPASIKGNPVVKIASWAFEGCFGVTSIVIQSGVTTIEDSAFARCANLTEISIPDSVTSVGGSAFYLCSKLEKIDIPDSVTKIGEGAFSNCKALRSVKLPGNLSIIKNNTFKYCTALQTLTLPDTIQEIAYQAFLGTGLVNVNLPSSLVTIGDYAFADCTSLQQIMIPTKVTSMGNKVFMGCTLLEKIDVSPYNGSFSSVDGVMMSPDKKTLILCPEGRRGEYLIPSHVMSTDYNAFYNCKKLTAVTASPNMNGIYSRVFYGCELLERFVVPEGAINIGPEAFAMCTGLRYVTIPASVFSIDSTAFNNCSDLTIIGTEGSTAQTFAEEKGFAFEKVRPKLENLSTISADKILLGDSVQVNCVGGEGASGYQYEVSFRPSTGAQWTTVQAYSSNTKVSIKPAEAGNYVIRVNVRDAQQDVVTEEFNLVVSEPIVNTSTVVSSAKVGTSVTVYGSASGTGSKQYAFYYRKPGATAWTTAQSFSYKNTVSVYLGTTGTYLVRVDVKDVNGMVVEKEMSVTAYDPLRASISVGAENVVLGRSVSVKAGTTGGYGAVQYQFAAKKTDTNTWVTVRDYSTNAQLDYKPDQAGKYTIRVTVKDEAGNITQAETGLECINQLKNTSSVAVKSAVVGSAVKVTADATGGLGEKQYAVWYQNPNNKKWYKAQDYSKQTAVTVKPKQTGKYIIRVNVKDGRGVVVKKDFSVNVFAALKNTSTVSASGIRLGGSVKVTASSTGGLGAKQYAVWYQNPNNKKWYKAQGYSTATTATIKPKQTGSYVIRVNVKDERGKVVKKDITLSVTK